jgi:hypothetical protein
MVQSLLDNEKLFERADRAYAETLRLLAWRVAIADATVALVHRSTVAYGINVETQRHAELAQKHLDDAQRIATARARVKGRERAGAILEATGLAPEC